MSSSSDYRFLVLMSIQCLHLLALFTNCIPVFPDVCSKALKFLLGLAVGLIGLINQIQRISKNQDTAQPTPEKTIF